MTLTELLKIDSTFITARRAPGLRYAERLWAEAGRPTESTELAEFLESVLTKCVSLGIAYPPILLKRKKQILRGEFKPQPPAGTGPASADPPGACAKCHGRGHHVRGFSGSLCMACLGTGRTRVETQ